MSESSSMASKFCLFLAATLSLALLGDFASAQAKTEKPAAKAEAKEEKVAAKRKGRLPAYYKDIVDEKQKEQIYKLQSEYADKLEELKTKLTKLEDERDSAIEGVLTAEQKDKLKKAKEEGSTKKKKTPEPMAKKEAATTKTE